jgi:hypothetical protein
VRVNPSFFLCNVAHSLVFHIPCANADVMTVKDNFHVDVILLKCSQRSSACIQSYELLLFCFLSSCVNVIEKCTFHFVLRTLVLVGRERDSLWLDGTESESRQGERSDGIANRYGCMVQEANPGGGRDQTA